MVAYQIGGSICCDDSGTSGPINLAGGISYVETIALLRTVIPNATDDSIVLVGGYYAQGDGGGGLYLYEAAVSTADNGGTIINQAGNIGAGRWVLENFGQSVSIRQFGAVMDGVTDDWAVINSGLAAVDDLFVPAGTSFVSGTLHMLRDGQKFHGVSAGPDDACSNLIFGPGSADCISLGDVAQIAHNAYQWQQLYDLNINATQRVGVTGAPNTAQAPTIGRSCCAVSILFGLRTQIARLNIQGAWNGIMNYCGASIDIDHVQMTGTRGDFNELHFGSVTTRCLIANVESVAHGAAGDVTQNTGSGVNVGAVIPMASVAGISTGWIVTGDGGGISAHPAHVTAIDPVNLTVTIDQNITSLIPAGTALTFQNQTIGLWLGSCFTGYQGRALRNTFVATMLQIDDIVNVTGTVPKDVWIYGLTGDLLGVNDCVNLQAGSDINLTELHLLSGSAGGRGVFMGANVTTLRMIGGEIAQNALAGCDIGGTGCQISDMIISQNGASGNFDGIIVRSSATAVKISDCKIGRLATTFGSQRYGVNNQGVAANVFLDGCDMRGNAVGAVNDTSLFTLGVNEGLSLAPGILRGSTNYFIANLATRPSRAHMFLYDDLIAALETAGVWALTDLCYVFAAENQGAALTNLKLPGSGSTNPQAFNVNAAAFVAGQGFTGDGSTSYIDLGVAAPALTNYLLNQGAAFTWSRTNSSSNTGCDFGVGAGANSSNFLINPRNAAAQLVSVANNPSAGVDTVADSLGLSGWVRNISTTYKTYKNGAALSTQSLAASGLPAGDFHVGHSQGIGFSARQIAFAWVGGNLTDAQVTALYNAVNAYLSSF